MNWPPPGEKGQLGKAHFYQKNWEIDGEETEKNKYTYICIQCSFLCFLFQKVMVKLNSSANHNSVSHCFTVLLGCENVKVREEYLDPVGVFDKHCIFKP